MTMSLEAMKAAREALGRSLLRLRGPSDRDYAEACDRALTLLDAAIQREEAQPPSGVVSREALAYIVGAAHGVGAAGHSADAAMRMVERFLPSLSAPSEPMVPRTRAMEAILDALTFDGRGPDERKDHFDRWRRETADRIAARILDGEASDD